MYDIFYYNSKPNVAPFEREADSLENASALSSTEYFWFINGNNDYTNFDFTWKVAPWEGNHIHVWPSQWQQNGGVYLARKGFREKSWHWRTEQIVHRKYENYDVFYIDMMNKESNNNFSILEKRFPNIKKTRFAGNLLQAINRCVLKAETKYIWILSSTSNYSEFDFGWHPSQWLEECFHVFPSNEQKFGDTFYVNVETFKKDNEGAKRLSEVKKINFCNEQRVTVNKDIDSINYLGKDMVIEILRHNFSGNYAVVSPGDSKPTVTPSNWSVPEVIVTSEYGSTFIVPKEIQDYDIRQLPDYPYVTIKSRPLDVEKPLDIIYLSNGEKTAEYLFNILNDVCPRSIKRIDKVYGRTEALKAAAEASSTQWFFLVPAKLEVYKEFDWDWQPDYYREQPKHYIFHARNPVNDLCYGHMAIVAYNKHLVLDTHDIDLDFTQAKPHTVIKKICGISRFNEEPLMAWRTTFREVIKLAHYDAIKFDLDASDRLHIWLTHAKGKNKDIVLKAANEAYNYFINSHDNIDKLKLSYDWNWLDLYFYKYFFNSK